MEVVQEGTGTSVVITPTGTTEGEFTGAVAQALRGGHRYLVVDLHHVAHVDSTGLAALLSARESLAAAGGRLTLARVGARVRRVLEVTHLSRVFETAGEDPGTRASRAA